MNPFPLLSDQDMQYVEVIAFPMPGMFLPEPFDNMSSFCRYSPVHHANKPMREFEFILFARHFTTQRDVRLLVEPGIGEN